MNIAFRQFLTHFLSSQPLQIVSGEITHQRGFIHLQRVWIVAWKGVFDVVAPALHLFALIRPEQRSVT